MNGTISSDAVRAACRPSIARRFNVRRGQLALCLMACAALASAGCGKDPVLELAKDLESSDADVRYEAVKALEDYGPEAAPVVPQLAEVLKDSNAKVRYRAAKALSKVGSAAKEAVPQLGEALSDPNPDVRYYAAKALAEVATHTEPVVAALAKALQLKGETRTRYYVLKCLNELGPKAAPALPAIRQLKQDPDEKLRKSAESILKELEKSRS